MIKTGKRMRNVNEMTLRDSAMPGPIRVPFSGQGKKPEVTSFIIVGWLLLMSSCHVSEDERQKCRLVSADTVTALITNTTYHSAPVGEGGVVGDDVQGVEWYLEVAGMKFRYAVHDEDVCVLKDHTLSRGDSVWLFLDWRGKYFVADTSDIQQAVDKYVDKYDNSDKAAIMMVYAMAAAFSFAGLMGWLFGLIERLQDGEKKPVIRLWIVVDLLLLLGWFLLFDKILLE
jgi:hypothetical protein